MEEDKVPENGSESNGATPESSTKDSSGTNGGVPNIINGASSQQPRKKSRLDLSSLPSRQYLDQTVVPILLLGITALAKERPDDPVMFLANFLVKNKNTYFNGASSATAT